MKVLKTIFQFYYEGFKSMTLGKTLWILILIKLFVMFAILKVFFFPNFLKSKGDSKAERVEYIINEINKR